MALNAMTPTVRIRNGVPRPGLMPPRRGWFVSGRVCYKEGAPTELARRASASADERPSQARRAGLVVARPSRMPSELRRSGMALNAMTPTVRIRNGVPRPGLMPPLRGWFVSGRVYYKDGAPTELARRASASADERPSQARRAGIYVACRSASHSSSVGAA